MSHQPQVLFDETQRLRAGPAVSWGAIFAGAVAAISLSILLFVLGSGVGFASMSPWANRGASAATFAISGAIWLIVTQWLSAAVGGYLAGRLRHRWLATHEHEIFFRDTAHGLVTWSVSTVIVVVVVGMSAGSLGSSAAHAVGAAANAGAKMGMEAAHGPMQGAGPGMLGDDPMYGAEKLFRINPAPSSAMAMGPAATMTPNNSGAGASMEAAHIAARSATTGGISDDDRAYLVSLVAAKAGVSSDEAQRRVDAFIAQVKESVVKAKEAADQARKTAAQAAIYTALAMLIGAFIASVSAALGGRLRDEHL